jgi:tight adherence protein B
MTAFSAALVGTALVGTALAAAVTLAAVAASAAVVAARIGRHWRVRRRWRRLHQPETVARRQPLATARERLMSAPVRVVGAASAVVALLGLGLGGPVAGVALAAYAALGLAVLRRRWLGQARTAARRDALDAVASLAADLAAGLPVGPAVAAAAPVLRRAVAVGADAVTVVHRLDVAVRVAESSGAPLAGVLDRLDGDLRAADRARGVATAQAAGARASAGLLAALPVAGIALSSVLGVDALAVLLHTTVGAAALLVAVGLQVAGLLWAARLARVEVAS